MKREWINQALSKLDFLLATNMNINGYCFQILGVMFMNFTLPWVCKPHSHDFYELHYVLEGECQAVINKVGFSVQPGDYYVIQPGTLHSSRSTWHIGFAIRWKIEEVSECKKANVDHNYRIYKYLQRMNDSCNNLVSDINAYLISKLLSIAMTAETTAHIVTQLETISLLISVPELIASSDSTAKELKKLDDNDESMVERCVRYITDNCHADIDVNDVARCVHLSYGYVSRVFKRKMGVTINEHINESRLHKAQYFLISSNESIQSIANRVGFSTESYFSASFKKAFQFTPSEYRRSHRRLSE